MPGRAFGIKMVRMAEVRAPISQDGVTVIRIVGASDCVSSFCCRKIQKMANKDTTFGYHPVGAPTCLCKQEVGKPRQNPVLGHRY